MRNNSTDQEHLISVLENSSAMIRPIQVDEPCAGVNDGKYCFHTWCVAY